MAKWPSGKAEACKAFTPGSNPGFASRIFKTPSGVFFIAVSGSFSRPAPEHNNGPPFSPIVPAALCNHVYLLKSHIFGVLLPEAAHHGKAAACRLSASQHTVWYLSN